MQEKEKKLWWQIYFFALIVILLIGYIFMFFSSELGYVYLIDFCISIFSLVGLFGLAFRKKIFKALFWKIYFFIYIAWDLFFNIILEPYVSQTPFDPVSLIGFAILVPLYIGLYVYAFRFMTEKQANNQIDAPAKKQVKKQRK